LGEGGFGRVFCSTHRLCPPSSGGEEEEWRPVAVKITSPYYAGRRGTEERIRTHDDIEKHCEEVKSLIRLQEHGEQHNILHLYEYFWSTSPKPQIHLVTDKLGMDLRDWFKSRPQPLTERVASEVAETVLHAIEFCHDHGVMHRDLKPDNILFKVGRQADSLSFSYIDTAYLTFMITMLCFASG
jgi:serine/threonine protein kinase